MPSWPSILTRTTTNSVSHRTKTPSQKLTTIATTLEPQIRYDWGDGQVTSTSESAKKARTQKLQSMPPPPYKPPTFQEQEARIRARLGGTTTRREWNA